MIVKTQKPINFINQCGCIVDYKELEKAIIWFSDKPTARVKSIYLYGRYPAVSIYERKIHVHRLLMMYWLGCDLDTKEYVHHIDKHPLNAQKENLAVISASKHQSQINKGKKQSPEFAFRRTNASCIARYRHPRIHDNKDLLDAKAEQ